MNFDIRDLPDDPARPDRVLDPSLGLGSAAFIGRTTERLSVEAASVE